MSRADFKVVRYGTCAGYQWVVDWVELGGDIPEMLVDGSSLYGHHVFIFVFTLVNGGTWLKPLRGDMLRTPEPETEVGRTNLPARLIESEFLDNILSF